MRLLMYFGLITLLGSCSTKDTLKIKGSDTEVNLSVLIAEEFHRVNNGILVSVSGGGSGLGIASLLNGNADIANSSRSMNDVERALFAKKNILVDSFVFAQDAIAVVVSDQLPVDSISVAQLAKVFNGESSHWSTLCKSTLPITIYGRQSNSGTHDYVKKILGIHFSPYAKQMNGNAQILEAIKADPSGIGYVGAGYVMKGHAKGIKVLPVYRDKERAVSPLDAAKIASGDYYLQRPLFQYYRKNAFARVKPFLDFEQAETGAKLIKASGYYPISTL